MKFQQELTLKGVPADRILNFGDLRFDSLRLAGAPQDQQLGHLLKCYQSSGSTVIVAGSVNSSDEQSEVFTAWQNLRVRRPTLKLVVAPRYVNDKATIQSLSAMLSRAGVDFVLRSRWSSFDQIPDVLVLDVFGELGHYYSIASICYIGRNHGVLEPLAFDCPTIVGPGWNPDYSAYPLYNYMVTKRGIVATTDQASLTAAMQLLLEDDSYRSAYVFQARQLIKTNQGAAERIIRRMVSLVAEED